MPDFSYVWQLISLIGCRIAGDSDPDVDIIVKQSG